MTCQIRIKEWLRLEEISEMQTEVTMALCLESLTSLYMQRLRTKGKSQKQALKTFICKAECSSEQFAAASSDSLPQPKQGVES